ncbi:MAG: Crp/Fnr family transcriptional regulator [Candidatus Sericytochromatia bacterium]
MSQNFIDIIKSIINLPEEYINILFSLSRKIVLKKGDFFIREGEIPNKFAFNIQGLFRYYYIDNKGNDFTKGFIKENELIISYSAMIQNKQSSYFIEALEDSIILVILYKDWLELVKKNILLELVTKSFLEKGFIKKESREREFLLDDAKTRYKNFLVEFSDISNRLKDYHIASYLGITPIALSRIKKNLKLNLC